MKNVYDVTKAFEEKLADYCGSKYAVSIDNQSNALFLCLLYEDVRGKEISIPSHTYMSVPCSIIHAGGKVKFTESAEILTGAYQLYPTRTWDSALRFTKDMYVYGSFMCLSFTGPYKHLKLSKGGAILTDDEQAYNWFKKARFSGRNEVPYHEDDFTQLGFNFYIMPEIATRGLLLMGQFYNPDGSKKSNEDVSHPYPDLSKFPIYTQ